jgi:hypothetical protein
MSNDPLNHAGVHMGLAGAVESQLLFMQIYSCTCFKSQYRPLNTITTIFSWVILKHKFEEAEKQRNTENCF